MDDDEEREAEQAYARWWIEQRIRNEEFRNAVRDLREALLLPARWLLGLLTGRR